MPLLGRAFASAFALNSRARCSTGVGPCDTPNKCNTPKNVTPKVNKPPTPRPPAVAQITEL
eukprot:2997580-Pyramimonas_sp.AAC.2